jgi:ethanolamine utilization microcompartment shell protein EutS
MVETGSRKLFPVIVTLDPGAPAGGKKLVMKGAAWNVAADVAIPSGVVTEIGPLTTFAGTVAVIVV